MNNIYNEMDHDAEFHDDEFYDDEYPISCDMCGGEAWSIGFLGNTEWFNCRACGWKFSIGGE